MMNIIFKGYRLNCSDLGSIENALTEIQKKVELKAKRLYAELLAKEIELFVDDITLNILPRPQNSSIYECCVNELNNKISWSSAKNTLTTYNLCVDAAVFLYKGSCYIKLNIPNERLSKEIKNIPNLQSYDMTDVSDKQVSGTWNEIMKIYSEGSSPLYRRLHPVGTIEVEWKKISTHFHSPEERMNLRLRYTLTSELLNLIGMQKEIPNYRLLPYLDEAILMLDLNCIKEEANRRRINNATVFVNITEQMVKANPNDNIPPKNGCVNFS